MRVLVLGGTRFVGHAVVQACLRAGWETTVFNRGVTGVPPLGAHSIVGDRYSTDDLASLAPQGPWNAVIDTSGYVPENVLRVARALDGHTDRYVFMSTVSVYEGWPVQPLTDDSPTLFCPPDAGPDYGEDVENGPTRYGYQKAGCERGVIAAVGSARATILRPGVVLGPREYVGRLPWWLNRMAKGGAVVGPGDPGREIQPVDVRDLADFAVRTVRDDRAGSFNVTSPTAGSLGDLLAACNAATGGSAHVEWVPDRLLTALKVREWSELPLWRTSAGVWSVDASRALAVGLQCRPIQETVSDTWEWLQREQPDLEDVRAGEIGLSDAKERRILNVFRATNAEATAGRGPFAATPRSRRPGGPHR